MSQLRNFLIGRKDVSPNLAVDVLIWLNYEGYKTIRLGGRPDDALVRREDAASVSLEKFLTKFVEFFFRKDLSRAKLEELYLRFTNRMDHEDADIVYKATEGKLELDLDYIREYAGDRKVGGDGAYVFREEYLPSKPVQAVEPKKQKEPEVDPLDSISAKVEPDPKPAEAAQEKPDGRRGRRVKKPAE